MKNFLIILFSIFCLSANGQDHQKRYDLLILKDGSEFRGKMLEYHTNEFLKFRTDFGQEITFVLDLVERVLTGQYDEINQQSILDLYKFNEEKLYLNIELTALMEDDGTGRGIQLGLIQQYSKWLGLGGGVAYFEYEKNTGRRVYPVFMTWRGYLMEKNTSPYLNMNLGYGLFFKDEDYGIVKARGGMMLNPQLGVRFGAAKDAVCTLAIGALFQKVTAEYEVWEGRIEEKITFKRSQISLGINF